MTTVTDTRSTIVQAIFLRGHVRLHSVGLGHSKLRKGDIQRAVEAVMQRKYRRSDWATMYHDLSVMIRAANGE